MSSTNENPSVAKNVINWLITIYPRTLRNIDNIRDCEI